MASLLPDLKVENLTLEDYTISRSTLYDVTLGTTLLLATLGLILTQIGFYFETKCTSSFTVVKSAQTSKRCKDGSGIVPAIKQSV